MQSGAIEPTRDRQGTAVLPGDQIRFDGWTLHRSTGELVREGASIRLQSQPLLVLELLLAEPGELVTRERLIARLWPGGVVDFDTALGDQPEQPRYIETIPRRGYRFIGRLDPPSTGGAPEVAAAGPGRERGRRTGWLVAAAVLTAVVAAGTIAWTDRVPADAPGSVNPQAQELYQRALYFLQRRGRSDLDLARRYFDEAVALDGLDRRDESDAALQGMIESRGRLAGFRIAEVYAHRGDADASFRWLDAAVAARHEVGWRAMGRRPLWILAHWPLLQTVRQDPRWESWHAAALKSPRQAKAG